MLKNKNFGNYLDHLMEYQTQPLPNEKLCTDYIILYDYLVELLEKDDVIGKFVVRKTQKSTNLNADILLDLTKLFDVRSYIRDPYLCLTLEGRENKRFENTLHPFCNKKLSIIPRNIKQSIWQALNSGLLANGSFVHGYKGDIYELNLPVNYPNDNCIRLNAFSDEINFNINLRILVKYSKNLQSEPSICKPFPARHCNAEWLAQLSSHINMPFDICLPKLESEMQQKVPNLVMVMRLIRALFKNNKKLCILGNGFLESIVYSEFMDMSTSKNFQTRNDYILKGVLHHIFNAFKTKNCRCFWNERLNLMNSFEDKILLSRACNEFKNLHEKLNKLRNKESLKYEELFDFFGKVLQK